MSKLLLSIIYFIVPRGRMLPVKPPTGKPASLLCVYASTGHNSAVLSLCVNENTMFSGSKGKSKTQGGYLPKCGASPCLAFFKKVIIVYDSFFIKPISIVYRLSLL